MALQPRSVCLECTTATHNSASSRPMGLWVKVVKICWAKFDCTAKPHKPQATYIYTYPIVKPSTSIYADLVQFHLTLKVSTHENWNI